MFNKWLNRKNLKVTPELGAKATPELGTKVTRLISDGKGSFIEIESPHPYDEVIDALDSLEATVAKLTGETK